MSEQDNQSNQEAQQHTQQNQGQIRDQSQNQSQEISFKEIATKWQKKWEDQELFKTSEDRTKNKYYVLEMFPYPSGYLHMGHVKNYSLGDVCARFKRMNGFNVLYPMGYDSFGLPAENAAMKTGEHPDVFTNRNIQGIQKQQKMLGCSYDWSREIATSRPEYYKWNQWLFLKFFEKGLVYRKNGLINWCPKCNTVLANEQVINGKCWRHGDTDVIQKPLEQWYLNIRSYADELLNDIEKLPHWPERVKTMQKNWIGKSKGTLIDFEILDPVETKKVSTFTTRIDTIFGLTYVVLAPEHELVQELIKGTEYEKPVKEFIAEVSKKTAIERTAEGKEKNGIFIGKYVINPFTGEQVPLWIADYALVDYGTGAVMAVPAHDDRDFAFAKKYNLPIKTVIAPQDKADAFEVQDKAYTEDGILINSKEFTGKQNREAISELQEWLKKNNKGGEHTNYRLRDWLISRQRYWGTPIPMVHCETCGLVPEKEENLPILLPKDVRFDGEGNPIATSETFMNCTCPKCGKPARRETDTMDTFFDSSWYFLRFTDPHNDKLPFDKEQANYWLKVDQYIGGIEHAILHLLYSRFFTKALRDLGLVDHDEFSDRLLTLGMVLKDGAKMSKSLGNVVDPGEIFDKYGPDTARTFILSGASPEKENEWSDTGVHSTYLFLKKLYNTMLASKTHETTNTTKDKIVLSKLHALIAEVSEDIDQFKYNFAINKIREFTNYVAKAEEKISREVFDEVAEKTTLLISPFAPHLAEEIWEQLGKEGFASVAEWPKSDESKIDETAMYGDVLEETIIDDIRGILQLAKITEPKKIQLIISSQWKYTFFDLFKTKIEETRNPKELISFFMANEEMRKHGKDITKIIPSALKDGSKIPLVVGSQEQERKVFLELKEELATTFNCEVELFIAEETDHPKARNASPGKPAIIVE